MKISVLVVTLALIVVSVASVRMWPSEQNTSHGWGLISLAVLGLVAINVWRYVRIRRTALSPKLLLSITIATVMAFLFAFMQWVALSV
jgi:hypothetical protein